MRRPILLGGNPYVSNIFAKDAKTLFDETGGNSGNLAFQYAIASHLRGNVSLLPWGVSPDHARSVGDIVVLPLANQLGAHTDLGSAAARLREINLPVLGIGLGAQADAQGADVKLQPGTELWLKTLVELSPTGEPNLGVRGAFTKSVIERLGYERAPVVTGCPSNFINPNPDLPNVLDGGFKKKPTNIAIMAGIPFIPKISQIEQDLADIVTDCGGAYIVQHGLEMLRLARNEFDLIAPNTLELARTYIRPQLSMDEFKAWCRRYAYAFYDVRAWMDFVRRFDFVVGTRFHGAMIAIQAGIPAACITHDSRTQEMCETMGIPHRHYDQINGRITADNVLDLFDFDAKRYQETRSMLLQRYLEIYRNADLQFSRDLLNI
jgi:hypothetical protein